MIQLRANKIKEGRATSFTYMVNDKKRLIGKIAAKVPEGYKEAAFMVPFPPLLSLPVGGHVFKMDADSRSFARV